MTVEFDLHEAIKVVALLEVRKEDLRGLVKAGIYTEKMASGEKQMLDTIIAKLDKALEQPFR